MKGSAFAATLPEKAGDRREQMILDAVRRRDIAPIAWVPIITQCTTANGDKYTATFKVSRDALRVGDATDSFRVTVNHRTAQHIADHLGAVLPTALLSDAIWKQATIQFPNSLVMAHKAWVDDGTMSHTSRMLQQSQLVDKMIAEAQLDGRQGLIADVGKDWITTNKLWQPYDPGTKCEPGHPRAVNYGWHLKPDWMFKSPANPTMNVLQPVGLCHTIGHTDYSQVVRLIRLDVQVCGPDMGPNGCRQIDIRRLATDPHLSCLVNHSGPLPEMRHPDVPPLCSAPCPDDKTVFDDDLPRCDPPFVFDMDVWACMCPPGQVITEDLMGCKPLDGVGGNGTPPSGGKFTPPGTIACKLCNEAPPPEIDPTGGGGGVPVPQPPPGPGPVAQAGMAPGTKLVMFAAGAALGYLAMTRLVPSPS